MRDTSTAKHHGLNHWLMLDLIGRKIRLHTDRLHEKRGHAQGRELEDWLKAESEVLRTIVLTPRLRSQHRRPPQGRAPRRRDPHPGNPPRR